MKDVIIIPAYNEEEKIAEVITEVQKYSSNIIVVDDGSTDNTFDKAKEKGCLTLRHRVNLGKGAALRTGCDFAVRNGAQKVVVMDADGQHQADEIPLFLNVLNETDLVVSYRKVGKNMPCVLKFGNGVINTTLNFLCGTKIKDSQCGYRAFTADSYRKIRWNTSDYFMETEMLIKASKKKLNYKQIPIETIYNDNYKGTTVIDGVKIFLKIIGGRIAL